MTPQQTTILRFLNGNLNQHGFLEIEPAIAARYFSISIEEMEQTIHILHIDEENKQKPLSDQKIVQLLEQSGILISRSTVAKYREEIGIPGSSKRKRF